MPHLPSTTTLRALEAAARLGSYSRAAEELGLTHGAVSHRLRGLERSLGRTLFLRQGNGMVPTAEAQRLVVLVRQALGTLETAFTPPRPAVHQLRVSMLPSFASRWLVPRLGAFAQAHPDIDLRIDARLEFARLGLGGVDCAVRYGTGGWPGVHASQLAGERLFPVCAPAYAARLALEQPLDLTRATLLRHDRQPWAPWFAAAGLNVPEPADTPVFSDTGLLLDAAVAGAGIALARERLVAGDLAHGRLIRLFNIKIADTQAYFFVRPNSSDALNQTIVDRFEVWSRAELTVALRPNPVSVSRVDGATCYG